MSEMRPAVRNAVPDHASPATASEGRLEIAGQILLATGEERPCLVRCVAGDSFEITGVGRVAAPGTRVVCRTNALGTVEGSVRDGSDAGFRMDVVGGLHLRARLAARIAWHLKAAGGDADLRSDARIVPSARVVRVATQDGMEAERGIDRRVVDGSRSPHVATAAGRQPDHGRQAEGGRGAPPRRGRGRPLRSALRPDDVTSDLVL